MWEKWERQFEVILKEADAIPFDERICNNEIDKRCQEVENEYQQTKSELKAKLEDLKTVLDILENNSWREECRDSNEDAVGLATRKAAARLSRKVDCEILEGLISYHIKKANWLFDCNRVEEALDVVEDVLKVDPQNEYVHSKLDEILNTYD